MPGRLSNLTSTGAAGRARCAAASKHDAVCLAMATELLNGPNGRRCHRDGTCGRGVACVCGEA